MLAAGHDSSPDSESALEALCSNYWVPLYAYVRRRVPDVNEAHDLTQAFFTELLEKNFIGDADPARGRFRAFLITAFKHFLSKQWDAAKAQKRGGGRTPLPLDFDSADSKIVIEPVTGTSPEDLYERDWAIALLDRIMMLLETEMRDNGKARQFAVLKGFLIGDHSGITYNDAGQALSISEAAAKMAASRMRRRYRELLRQEITQTVASPNDVDDEIRRLFETLAQA